MFKQAFKIIDDVLWKEIGYTTELDYVAGVDQIDNHIPEKYSHTDVRRMLGLD